MKLDRMSAGVGSRSFVSRAVMRLFGLLLTGLALLSGFPAWAATQYWDTDAGSGLQGGDAPWSTSDLYWSGARAGTALSAWVAGNDASFSQPSNGAPSTVMVTTPFNVRSVTVAGSPFSIIVTNGGALQQGGAASVLGASAANNTMIIVGGAGVTSRWELGTSSVTQSLTVGSGAAGTNNVLLIDGAGTANSAMATNISTVTVGSSQLEVTRGGALYASGILAVGGTNGSLTVSQGGRATFGGTVNSTLGLAATDSDNYWLVTDTGSVLTINSGYINYGSGSRNALVVSNGATLFNAGYFTFGTQTGTNKTATVTGPGSYMSTASASGHQLTGTNNSFTISNGGVVSGATMNVGQGAGSYSVLLTVTGSGSVLTNTTDGGGVGSLVIGNSSGTGGNHRVVISDGGAIFNTNGSTTLGYNGGHSNSLLVTGSGSVLTNSGGVKLGANGPTFISSYNTMTIANSGKVVSASGNVGAYTNSCGNVATVTDPGSLWQLGAGLGVGTFWMGASNQLVVANGGVIRSAAFTVGGVTSSYNSVTIAAAGAIYSAGAVAVGGAVAAYGNSARVGGSGSLWDMGLQTLTIGHLASTNNVLTLTQGGAADRVGALTVVGPGNGLVVSNGASFTGTNVTLGQAGSAGSVIAADSASLSTYGLVNGSASSNNTVTLNNNAFWNLRNGLLTWGSGLAANNSFVVDASSWIINAGGLSVNDAGRTVTLASGLVDGLNVQFSGGALVAGNSANAAPVALVLSNYTLNASGSAIGGASTVGLTGSSNNTLTVLPGSLWNGGSQALNVGNGANATGNVLRIDGMGVAGAAVVTNMNGVVVGTSCPWNTLIVTNGGRLYSTGAALCGTLATASNNLILIAGGGPGGAGAKWDMGNAPSLYVGGAGASTSASYNQLIVDGGGVTGGAEVSNLIELLLGAATGQKENRVIIRNGGLLSATNVRLGFQAVTNTLSISVYGGSATSRLVLATTLAALNTCALVVDGAGVDGSAVVTAGSTVSASSSASLTVTNKGLLYSAALSVNTGASNSMAITTGGKVYSTGVGSVGNAAAGFANSILVRDSGSLWDLGSQALNIGLATSTNNALTIDQGGTVDNVGALTVAGALNALNLRGGTLGAASTTYTNGLFTVGDGSQTATLKALAGGVLVFNTGLRINTNATLAGNGAVSGAGAGVSLLNGATLNPGTNGVGALMVLGSNLTCNGAIVYRCEITDMKLGPGVGWDVVNVNSQLVLNGTVAIELDSMGAPAANFDAGKDYNIRILSYGAQTGYNPANVTLDTTDFQNGGAWSVTNAANALWLVYRGAAAPPAATFTWKVPNSGVWSDPANWTNNAAPTAGGDPGWILEFGDNGTRYAATNNLAGAFQLNQLRLSSMSGVTNGIAGNQLAFTNTEARIDYVEGIGGSFVVSNVVRLTTDTTFGGSALAGTLTLAGVATNLGTLTKNGTWTLALGNNNNNFIGPVVVDSPDGILRLDNTTVLNGSGSVTLSNGMIQGANSNPGELTFSNAKHNRQGLIKGSGAFWTNSYYVTIGQSATNVRFVVDGGRLYENNLAFFTAGSRDCSFVITNGGQLFGFGNASALGGASTNCLLHVTGSNSVLMRHQALAVGSAGGSDNTFIIEKGALMYGDNTFLLSAGVGSSHNAYEIRSGAIGRPYGLSVRGSYNSALITGSGTLVTLIGGGLSTVNSGTDFGNVMTIADRAVVTNYNMQMAVHGAYSNALVITNGGALFANATAQYVAYGTNSLTYDNRLVVSGTGSVWNLTAQPLNICATLGTFTGRLNQLVVEAGGLVTNVTSLIVARGTNASDNSLTVNGGVLQAVSLLWSNTHPNSVTLTGGGDVGLMNLFATNENQTFAFNGGTLSLKNSIVSNGTAFVAGDGAQAATLNLLPGIATNLFADGLVITNNGVLAGNGLIQGDSVVFGTMAPGAAAVGAITNSGAFTLKPGANTAVELAAYTAPGLGWDCLTVTNGALQVDGTLSVLLTGGFAPTNTQSFVIMTNIGSSVSGSFASGGTVPAYTNVGGKSVGTFQVNIGNRGVVLELFKAYQLPPGTLIYLR